jgi:proline dehydrogenase
MRRGLSFAEVLERLLAGRWIAGERVSDAVRRTKELNAIHTGAIINCLGEDFDDKQEAASAVFTYLQLMSEIKKSKLDASISVKLTQLGLRISKGLALRNLERISNRARKLGIFVWIDMESPDAIDDTLSIYESQARKRGVGITLQARMKRSDRDMRKLLRKRAVIRLVKGSYKDIARYAFENQDKTDQSFVALMRMLFKGAKEFTIATHDPKMIDEAYSLNRVYRRKTTFAFLNGVRNAYSERLAMSGNRIAVYVPFGSRWVDYAYRRFKEFSNVKLIVGSVVH